MPEDWFIDHTFDGRRGALPFVGEVELETVVVSHWSVNNLLGHGRLRCVALHDRLHGGLRSLASHDKGGIEEEGFDGTRSWKFFRHGGDAGTIGERESTGP